MITVGLILRDEHGRRFRLKRGVRGVWECEYLEGNCTKYVTEPTIEFIRKTFNSETKDETQTP
jgi:hypothetical protein